MALRIFGAQQLDPIQKIILLSINDQLNILIIALKIFLNLPIWITMSNKKIQLTNCFVLLMGFPGVGNRTIGEALARKTNARFTHHHELYDPIFKLFCNDYEDQWNLTSQMWGKLNEAQAVYFGALADVCSREDSFIYTEMMLDKDPYHQID